MAKKRRKSTDNVAGFFRALFEAKPALLHGKSNKVVKERWLAAHPGVQKIPPNVLNGMANVKSLMRRAQRERKAGGKMFAQHADALAYQSRSGGKGLAALEENIDDCVALAIHLDKEGLQPVISHLRRARNLVVFKIGQ
jgi:hypothetical protein